MNYQEQQDEILSISVNENEKRLRSASNDSKVVKAFEVLRKKTKEAILGQEPRINQTAHLRERQRLISQMLEMQIPHDVAEYALTCTRFRGVMEAIEFLNPDENGFLEHSFIEQHEGVCLLCEYPADKH